MGKKENPRAAALSLLIDINESHKHSHTLLQNCLKNGSFDGRDRAFVTRLVEGTLERMAEEDQILSLCSSVPVEKMKPFIRNLLRMSVYQLLDMDRVPEAAVVNEAVSLAKVRGYAGLSGFVNGVLRAVVCFLPQWHLPDPGKDPTGFLHLRYGIPEGVLDEWLVRYGYERTEKFLIEMSGPHPLWLRTNLLLCTPGELRERLIDAGMTVHPHPRLPYALAVEGETDVRQMPGYADGWFYVQDPTSMLAAETAAPKAGDVILDLCAAPGGKSTHAAQLLASLQSDGTGGSCGLVQARDLTPRKVALIEENIARLRIKNMSAVCMDASVRDPDSVGRADIVLADLPCSGWGALGKKKEIRYEMKKERQKSLVDLQRKILDTAADYVKAGGVLLYSTCTIRRSENEDQTEAFLAGHPEFSLEMQRQYLPGEFGCDGFFLARMVKERHTDERDG